MRRGARKDEGDMVVRYRRRLLGVVCIARNGWAELRRLEVGHAVCAVSA